MRFEPRHFPLGKGAFFGSAQILSLSLSLEIARRDFDAFDFLSFRVRFRVLTLRYLSVSLAFIISFLFVL
jgi:hypothetical protein